jgi:hypothetical protein
VDSILTRSSFEPQDSKDWTLEFYDSRQLALKLKSCITVLQNGNTVAHRIKFGNRKQI